MKPGIRPKPGKIAGSVPDQRVDQEERLRLTQYSMDHFPESAIWTDMEARILYVNDATCDMLGYTRDELLAMSVSDIAPNYSRDRFAAFIQSIQERKALTFESEHVTKSGRRIPVEVTTHYQKYGAQEYIISFSRDISGRKQVEDTLRKNEKFLNHIFNSFQDGIGILDKDLNIVRVNRIMENWHPYMMPLQGKKCYHAFHCRDKPCEVCPSLRAMKLKTMQSEIVPLHGEHGEQKGWLEIYSFPLLDDRGDLTGVIEHVRDITARKRAEDALEETKTRAELYLDLMSHDINNMNHAGIGFLELLLDSPRLDRQERMLLHKAIDSLEGSTRIIRNVRKLQMAQSGEMRSHKVDVGQVLDEVKSHYAGTRGEALVDYDRPAGCEVMANELLFDVFSNLVGNAIKHSAEKGRPVVKVRAGRSAEGGRVYCRITVEDDGPGVPDEMKDKIFGRLRRGETKAGGKGLGLYLVKYLVESYGGKVWVEDRVSGDHTRGARFVVMIPAAEPEAAPDVPG
ncbi:sensor histidine kinase [Methanocella arvoryzae]|uniref:sensor histidine kinase n=1 Tax=Methanocella arvoryzae TaxID=1175445 RepID=UPI001305137A|nr:PAS domain-containing sensor histidine kinase [Methanocella arvoryzae]